MTDRNRGGRTSVCRDAAAKRHPWAADPVAARERKRRRYAADPEAGRGYARRRTARRAARTPAQIEADRRRLRPDGLKRCRRGHKAPLDAFPSSVARADGLADLCSPCGAAANAARRTGRYVEEWVEADAFRCGICLGDLGPEDEIHADHVIPLNRGGPDVPENVRPAHAACNVGKGDHLPVEYLPEIHPYLAPLLRGVTR